MTDDGNVTAKRAEIARARVYDPITDDDRIRQALRPVRGCATDEQWQEVRRRLAALIAGIRAGRI